MSVPSFTLSSTLSDHIQTMDLESSGSLTVMAQALYAIVGAVALERGALEANKIARDKILKPLGFTVP